MRACKFASVKIFSFTTVYAHLPNPTNHPPLRSPRFIPRKMEPAPSSTEILLLIHRQNETMYGTFNALARNVSESLGTINLLQQENTRLNEVIQAHEVQSMERTSNQTVVEPPERTYPASQETGPAPIPLIQRIGDRAPAQDEVSPITFPSISDIPVIRETPTNIPLIQRISGPIAVPTIDPPPLVETTDQTREWGPNSEGEGVRQRQTPFAWSANQWRQWDKEKNLPRKGIRRNSEGELDIGDLYTYTFILRALHNQNTWKNTPRSIKKGSLKSWSLVESKFIRAVVEVVLEPGQEVAWEALNAMSTLEVMNPGSYLTDAITETQEFPLELAAELLVQRGATKQWFNHRWTIGYAKSYLSEWGKRNYAKLPDSRIADKYCYVFYPVSKEQENPFSSDRTPVIVEDENVAHLSLAEDLLNVVPTELTPDADQPTTPAPENSPPPENEVEGSPPTTPRVPTPRLIRQIPEFDGIEINTDSPNMDEWLIY